MQKLLLTLLVITLSSCSMFDDVYLVKQNSDNFFADKTDDELKNGLLAYQKQCEKLVKGNGYRAFSKKSDLYKAEYKAEHFALCERAKGATDAKSFFADNFNTYRLIELLDHQGFFTGYYEIALEGSRKKTDIYKHPLYKKPKSDVLRKKTRAQIENGAFKNKGLELVYVKSKPRLFFLQIQGSGIVVTPEGETINIGYAGQNGQKYYAIGKYLVENEIYSKDEITALKIIDWLEQNPDKAEEVMGLNKSYIYFTERDQSATGSLGVELVGEGSIAIDRKKVPLGAPIYINIGERGFEKMLIAQDTGGAIKGNLRGDIFFGRGLTAEDNASKFKDDGKKYILIPKGIPSSCCF